MTSSTRSTTSIRPRSWPPRRPTRKSETGVHPAQGGPVVVVRTPAERPLSNVQPPSGAHAARLVLGFRRHDHKPVILLINNGGYTIERGYLGKTEPYNDIANWACADPPKVLHPGASARSFVARTCGDLQNAHAPQQTRTAARIGSPVTTTCRDVPTGKGATSSRDLCRDTQQPPLSARCRAIPPAMPDARR
jgi:hypothetical protein